MTFKELRNMLGVQTVGDMSSVQLQNYATKYGIDKGMSDAAVGDMFGSMIRKKQAEEAKGKKSSKRTQTGMADRKASVDNSKSRGGMPKKAAMMRGGMANGKEHMYAAGGAVKDNPGLKALKAASPEAYNKVTGR